ncbi:sulfur carrier protein ThiS [Lyngbya confervoides]|uniref:Sulfur carrier protein ThiS n=1 Tax=Lyngbya confervoides BDU141951 TaxID=1574623 RepID=A0ABD4T5G7_9CYAN|nr:sulfur carrier protein ThiS [Lyngbya confervoides]MCM1983715.1 sulfur carrier protein ThiS [Lyngbya confervoides BDU141951]
MPDSDPIIRIQVNGNFQEAKLHLPLLTFLADQNLNPRLIAIEYNGEILHRQFWPQTRLAEGDRLEIVTIVGGG